MIRYTLNNTINEVYQEKAILPYMHLLYSDTLLAFIPEEYRDVPLKETEKHVIFPWGMPFSGKQFLDAAAYAQEIAYTDSYELLPLWMDETKDYVPDVSRNDLTSVFLIRKKSAASQTRPAAVMCPGGGYETLAFDNEGLGLANKLEEMGFAAFILNYRLAPNRFPAPQHDLMLAIKFVRANAERFGVDPGRVLAMGSSAGGHLCASMAMLCEELENGLNVEIEKQNLSGAAAYRTQSGRPDALCLNYPVISFLSETHEPSFQALTGGDESLREKLSVEQHIPADYPRTFVWTCLDDSLVPASNTARMGAALEKAEIDHRCILFPQGEHGCGLGYGTSAEGWIDQMGAFLNWT